MWHDWVGDVQLPHSPATASAVVLCVPQDLANVDDDVHVVDGVELANVSAEAPACKQPSCHLTGRGGHVRRDNVLQLCDLAGGWQLWQRPSAHHALP